MFTSHELNNIFERNHLTFLGQVKLERDDKSFERFRQWLREGRHGEMSYMENHLHLREDPSRMESALSWALIFALPYRAPSSVLDELQPKIAKYARMDDYHRFMRTRAQAVVTELSELLGGWTAAPRITIDSAPILERSLAEKTEFGFIGKNTCYIHPTRGSFLLLGEILVPKSIYTPGVKVAVNPEIRSSLGGCGSCKRCQTHCPTGALDQDYRIDAKRCLSYWTIEHRGTIPFKYWKYLGKYWFGCDICQDVCPYNRGKTLEDVDLPLRSHLSQLDLFVVATMDQATYEGLFGGSPMTRAKKQGLQRNALIAMTVTKDSRLQNAIDQLENLDTHTVVKETIVQIRKCMT